MRPLAFLLCLGLLACSRRPPYFPESEFWQPLPAQPEIDPESGAFIDDLLRRSKKGGRIFITVDHYNVPIARAGTTRTDFRLTHPDAGGMDVIRGVPVPEDAEPALGTDGHLVVLDEAAGVSYEFWQARKEGGAWRATSGVRFDLRGDGVNRAGSGIRASSLSLLLGVITYDEARGGGPIEHALSWAFDTPNSAYYAPPAASSDGWRGGRRTSVPEGARLQLDPALDVTTLGLSPLGVRIAQALQRYGMFCVDAGGDSHVYAEALQGERSWRGLLAFDEVQRIPVERLRVLKLPRRIPIPVP